MDNGKGQSGGVNISGAVGTVGGDIVGGDKITVQLLLNPIGKTIEAETRPGPNMHVDQKHQFSISWPEQSDWIPSSRMGAYQLSQLGVVPSRKFSLLCGLIKMEYNATFAVFKIRRPDGTCMGFVTVDSYLKAFKDNDLLLARTTAALIIKGITRCGFEIVSQYLGNESPMIVYRETNDLTVVARVLLGKDYAYVICSPIYPPNTVYNNLREDTNVILNSFKLLT